MIAKDVFVDRRRRFAKFMREGIAFIPTSPDILRNADTEFPHRPDSNFYYLTGFSESDALLVVIAGKNPRSVLFCKKKNKHAETWTGYLFGPSKAKADFGFDETYALDQMDKMIPKLLSGQKYVFFDWQNEIAWTERVRGWLSRSREICDFRNPRIFLSEMRLIKHFEEIRLMRYAAKTSALAHKKAMQICRPGMMEYELEAEIVREFRSHGSSLLGAYTPIIAGGNNACTLHYIKNNGKLKAGDLVLVDAGCEIDNYASDITRTYPVNGTFSREQKIIYEIVLKAQAAAIEKAKPGNSFTEPHVAAVKIITEELVKWRLLRGDVKKLIKTNSYSKFFMHQTSHWLGMDVHDTGAYRLEGKPRKLLPGMVLTVEPGIYIPRGIKGVDKKWWEIAVRIEDDVLITKNGNEILSKDAPKTVEDIEFLVGSLAP